MASKVETLKKKLRDLLKRIGMDSSDGDADRGGKGSPNVADSMAAMKKRAEGIKAQIAKIQ